MLLEKLQDREYLKEILVRDMKFNVEQSLKNNVQVTHSSDDVFKL